MASLLYHTGRTARWFTALGAFDIMCMARAPYQGSDPREPSGRPRWAPIEGRGSHVERFKGAPRWTSSGRYIWISFDLLKRLNGALAMTGPRTSCFRETTKNCLVSECQTEPRSCMVLGLKSMDKLTTLDKYLSVRQNQGLAWSSDSNLWKN